ncbi:hypothetical protein TIFTF001_013142 [Ficus carica]|uniref:Uncharacterized protein n=1 Tax=Ficus carica TaxID=3494 RepID=A0AA88D2L4_FICCA|nr:hypothetical protein TIFTF001_013142 [Ficus carica]
MGEKLLEDNLPNGNQVAILILCGGGQSNYATFGGGDDLKNIFCGRWQYSNWKSTCNSYTKQGRRIE